VQKEFVVNLRMHRRTLLAGALGGALASTRIGGQAAPRPSGRLDARLNQQAADWQPVEQALGATGQLLDGDVFRVSMPRADLKVMVRDVSLVPAFALGSYAAFKQAEGQAMVMGDLVLLDTEVNPVVSGLFQAGFSITGIHNHLNEMNPHVMYVHYTGQGDRVQLAQGLRQALAASATSLGQQPAGTPQAASPPTRDLPVDRIAQVLGRQAKVAKGGVVQVTVPRAETITEGGMELLPAMGVATALNFQPLGNGQAAITGDFVMVAAEVNPVAQALRGASIDVTALHNHHLGEDPRLFYMHFFATGDPAQLAQGLRAALDKTNSKQG
jgi:Domain of Unknown Function (DUF1259)